MLAARFQFSINIILHGFLVQSIERYKKVMPGDSESEPKGIKGESKVGPNEPRNLRKTGGRIG